MSTIKREAYDAIVVLGKNWKKVPGKDSSSDFNLQLSLESKMSATAAAVMYMKGLTKKILFTGGRTAGELFPSEAEAMADYILKKFPGHIDHEDIITEDESIDTVGNAEKVRPILIKKNLGLIALVTVGYHLKRADRVFREHGIYAVPLTTESIIKDRNRHYEYFAKRFGKSAHVFKEKVKEYVAGNLPAPILRRITGTLRK